MTGTLWLQSLYRISVTVRPVTLQFHESSMKHTETVGTVKSEKKKNFYTDYPELWRSVHLIEKKGPQHHCKRYSAVVPTDLSISPWISHFCLNRASLSAYLSKNFSNHMRCVMILKVLVRSNHIATWIGGAQHHHQWKFALWTKTPRYKEPCVTLRARG